MITDTLHDVLWLEPSREARRRADQLLSSQQVRGTRVPVQLLRNWDSDEVESFFGSKPDEVYAFEVADDGERHRVIVGVSGGEIELAECGCREHQWGCCPHTWACVTGLVTGRVSLDTGWKVQLDTLGVESGLPEGVMASSRFQEAWFVLHVDRSHGTQGLYVTLHYRERRKDGAYGRLKPLECSDETLDGFENDADRELLNRVLGCLPVDDGRSSYGSARAPRNWVRIPPRAVQQIMPEFCCTGHALWVSTDPGRALDRDAQPLAWTNDRFEFRLRVERRGQESGAGDAGASQSEGAGGWRLLGEWVSAAGESVPLEEATFFGPAQLILHEGKLARVQPSASLACATGLAQLGPIEAGPDAGDEFRRRIWQLPGIATAALPPELQLPTRQLEPIPRMSVVSAVDDRVDQLRAQIHFEYGPLSCSIRDPRDGLMDLEAGELLVRDRDFERRAASQLEAYNVRWLQQQYVDGADLYMRGTRFVELCQALLAQGWVVEAEGRRMRTSGTFRINVVSGVDWFEVHGSVRFGENEISLPQLLQAAEQGERFIRLGDGSHGMLPEQWLRQYAGLCQLGDVEEGVLRFRNSQALLIDSLLASQPEVEVDAEFERVRERLQTAREVVPTDPAPSFHGTLRDYQRHGLGWFDALRDLGLGGCLADDMGLGKTIQVLAMLDHRRVERGTAATGGAENAESGNPWRPSLVVVPRSLVFNWLEEAHRFTPELRMLNYSGSQREQLLEAEANQFDVMVTTYGVLRRDIMTLREIQFDYAILDESQAIKNAESQSAKAVRLLNADHRLAMTGTPVENHVGELWSLFEFLNPGMLGRSAAFGNVLNQGLSADGEALQALSRAVRPFLLRRTKEEVLSELPEKLEQTLVCEMGQRQRDLYDELRDYYRASLQGSIARSGLNRSKIQVLEALLRLRQVACHPGLVDAKYEQVPSAKLDALLDQLEATVDEGHKALVFSQFTSLLGLVRQRLDRRGIGYEYLDGRTRNRQAKVERFQNDASVPVFLISLKAGGHGLNLTAADYVFILDPWWNPAVEAQAVDRAHRMGQQRRVFAYRLICRDTVEEKILELQQRKRDLAEAIISRNNSLISELTAEDLDLLLG